MEPKLAVHKNISIDYMVGFYFIFFCYTAILIPLLELYKTVLLAASFNYLNLGLSWFIMFYAIGRLSLLMMSDTRRLIELFSGFLYTFGWGMFLSNKSLRSVLLCRELTPVMIFALRCFL